jgi:glycerate-2-kinase
MGKACPIDINNIMDIIERIDEVLSKIEGNYLSAEEAVEVIEYIISEVPEDRVLLEPFANIIKEKWTGNNDTTMINFKKILSAYGIYNDGERRAVLEMKGKTIVRKFIELKNKDKIKKIIDK